MNAETGQQAATPQDGQANDAPGLSPEAMRAELAQAALDSARMVPLALAGLFAVFFIFNAITFPAAVRLPLLVHDAVLALAFFGLWWAIRQQFLVARTYHLAVGVSVLLVASNILLAEWLSRDPLYTSYILVTVIAASNFVLSPRLLWFTLTLTVLGWLLVTAPLVDNEGFVHLTFALVAALAVAVITQISRLTSMRQLITARHRDARQQRELHNALEAAGREMAERERLAEQLRQAQKMEAVGNLAGGLAHEMNNVLTVILATASAGHDDEATPAFLVSDLEDISNAARRGQSLTRNLLEFARKSAPRREPLALGAVVEEVARLLRHTIDRRIRVSLEIAADTASVVADAQQLQQVLMNLCLNAAQAISGNGEVKILIDNLSLDAAANDSLPLPPGDWVRIRVQDDGSGMSEEVREHALEPFFTTKEPGKGSGLGLAVVYGLVTDHGGAIHLESHQGRGTTVTVLLPPAAPNLTTACASPPEKPIVESKCAGSVLVIDDELAILDTVSRILTHAGLRVLTAASGAAGVEIFAQRRPDVVLLDMSMPGMDGASCMLRLRQLDPTAVVCLTSGYADNDRLRQAVSFGAQAVLPKPFAADELLSVIRRLLPSEKS